MTEITVLPLSHMPLSEMQSLQAILIQHLFPIHFVLFIAVALARTSTVRKLT